MFGWLRSNSGRNLRRYISKSTVQVLPAPWTRIAVLRVGGLVSIGFSMSCEYLLVYSWQGAGLVRCSDGEKIARDDAVPQELMTSLDGIGIGPITGEPIQMSGLFGGGLHRCTQDGWSVDVASVLWPLKEVLLFEPGQPAYLDHSRFRCFKIGADSEMRAAGFSHDGLQLVVATASDLTIYGRD